MLDPYAALAGAFNRPFTLPAGSPVPLGRAGVWSQRGAPLALNSLLRPAHTEVFAGTR